jgi:hypothetical protein
MQVEGFMRTKISVILAVCLILVLFSPALRCQEQEEQFQLILVIDEAVKPSMQQQYYEAAKKYIAFLKDNGYPFSINTYWMGDNHVYWTMPIQNYAQIDKIIEVSGQMIERDLDSYQAVTEAFKGTYESTRMCVYAFDQKYSMFPQEETMESGEDDYVFWDFYYFEPGTEMELNQLLDEWKAFLADKKIVQSWGFYWGMMGTDNPVLVMAASAKDQVEFWQENARMWEILGKEAETYVQKMMEYVRKQEQKSGWYQKELSYAPAEKEK